MKKTLSLLSLLVVLSCGEQQSKDLTTVLSEGSLEELQQEKNSYHNNIQKLEEDLALINAAINEKDTNKNIALVTSAAITAITFKHYVTFQGTLKSHKNLALFPEVPGILKKVYVKEGQKVKKGALLAVISDGGMNNQLEQLKLQTAFAKTTFERQQRLWDQKIGAEIQFLEAKTKYLSLEKSVEQMKAQLAKTKIYAPFSGIIDEVIVEVGSNVNPGRDAIIRIINLDKMYVASEIPEIHIVNMHKKKEALVKIPVLGITQEAEIGMVGNFINPNNRSFRVEVPLDNTDGKLKPNMTVEVNVNDYTKPEAIMVSSKNILENAEGRFFVFKLEPEDSSKSTYKAVKTFVKLGKSTNNTVEIIEGLLDGDRIVEQGIRLIRDQQLVRVTQS